MYYSGASTTTIKPVTRRTTWTRPMFDQLRQERYLMKPGRRPWNRQAYPTTGVPVGTHTVPKYAAWQRLREQQQLQKPDAFSAPGRRIGWMRGVRTALERRQRWTRGLPITTPTVGYILDTDMSLEPGRQLSSPIMADMSLEPGGQLGGVMDVFKVPTLTTSFVPAPTTTAPSSTGSVWNPITSLMNLWDARPQVLKDMRFTVDPNTTMRALQNVVKPGQVAGAVNWLGQQGVRLDYRGMPVSGETAGFGYRLAGVDWASYLPWIIGGGVALLVLPKLMGKR